MLHSLQNFSSWKGTYPCSVEEKHQTQPTGLPGNSLNYCFESSRFCLRSLEPENKNSALVPVWKICGLSSRIPTIHGVTKITHSWATEHKWTNLSIRISFCYYMKRYCTAYFPSFDNLPSNLMITQQFTVSKKMETRSKKCGKIEKTD